MLKTYACLAQCQQSAQAQAAFIAGYLCHLLADWLWIGDIFVPAFGMQAEWSEIHQRLYLHNVLRAYLDQQIISGLFNGVGVNIGEVTPNQWLPFVEDRYLFTWRDYLAEQLQPGAKIHTIEVLARRQGATPEEYMAILGSEERMENEILLTFPGAC
jgi:hypothetical protein